MSLEREVKLRFAGAEDARAAVLAAGATPLRGRRLQQDCLLDTADGLLRGRRVVLRVRREPGGSTITFKGPTQPATVKLREEIEARVSDPNLMLQILEALGFHPWFRYEKYREEFDADGVIVAVDETPVGAFVEIEGTERGITLMASALGRSAGDYVLDSYRGLFVADCVRRGVPVADMLFGNV